MLDPISAVYRILQNTRTIMAAQDDMTTAIGGLTTAVGASNAQIDALVAQLAAGAKASGMDDATVESFVAQIKGLTGSINGELAKVAQPAAPTPASDPAPTSAPGTTGA